MKFGFFGFLTLVLFTTHGYCGTAIYPGYRVTLAVPTQFSPGFAGRAILMETIHIAPTFKTTLSVEAINGKYSCSLQVLLGDVKVWSSGHYSQFYITDVCVLELTEDGDLQLKGPKNKVGWRSGTSGQGVERLEILRTGNLVLADRLNTIKWQSFNFPTDVMLWGQRLNVATRLNSFPANSSSYYSFEIEPDRVVLYLNAYSGKWKYSYWEFKPSKNRNITYVEVGSGGLELFNDKSKKIAQIPSHGLQPLRFLALSNRTGNLGLYFYSLIKGKFEADFKALNTTCDQPSACKPYGICTFKNICSCIWLLTTQDKTNYDCGKETSEGFCGRGQVEMLELDGIASLLKDAPRMVNVSKERCASLCLKDCECLAALYSSRKEGQFLEECILYKVVNGVKQIERGTGLRYMVKVPKGSVQGHGKSSVKKWVVIIVGVLDGLIILLVVGGFGYYLLQKRRTNLHHNNDNT